MRKSRIASISILTLASVCGVLRAEDFVINFFDAAFLPTSVTLEVGDTVTWNHVAGSHVLTSGIPGGTPGTVEEPGALFEATIDPQNPTFTYTFDQMGQTYGFFDANNPAQIGSITVLDDTLVFDVGVVDNAYIPVTIEIFEGDSVRWVHEPMEMLHTVTSGITGGDPGTIYEPGFLFNEESSDTNPIFQYTFDTPMDLPYFCIPHVNFGMTGEVIVQSRFIRGDADRDSSLTIGDAVTILSYLFQGATASSCLDAMDIDDGGQVNIADAIALLGYLFSAGATPAAPFPSEGPDRSSDSLICR